MYKAMVVDDSRTMRTILSRALAEAGFEVHQEANGRDALDYLQRDGASLRLVLVDWNMPEMTGLEFVRAVRSRPEFLRVRLLMVTTETEIEQMARALAAGADEYLMKPFTVDALKDKLELMGTFA
jgi:two-component system, chemotaxis family, chemotaxis protein CheY